MPSAAGRLVEIETHIAEAAAGCGRDPRDVRLIAVSKTFGAPEVELVLAAGCRRFGENRVQEAQEKWPLLREGYPDIELHLVGRLQSNKVRDAVALFDAIHSVDRDALAVALAREMIRQERLLTVFVQVNTGEELQKSGVVPQKAADFVRRCRDGHGLPVHGLMCIPPAAEDPVPHFDMLRRLSEALDLPLLSMGMSADYAAAIACGATHVRVGSAIFGERKAFAPDSERKEAPHIGERRQAGDN